MDTRTDRLYDLLDNRYAARALLARLRTRIGEVEAVAAQLQALSSGQQLRIVQVSVPALLLGGTNTQTIAFGKPMPSEVFNTSPQFSQLLGNGKSEVTAQTAGGVTVKTTATVATIAAQILVICWTN